ncbi:MAG: hypothetical protein WAX44_01935 [Minisyncoccia bacterium]
MDPVNQNQIKNDTDQIMASLSNEVSDLLSEGVWENRVREVSQKYGLTPEQTENLIDDVLFVIIGQDDQNQLLSNLKETHGFSPILSEQIFEDLDKRVFDYALKFIESRAQKKETPRPVSNVYKSPENSAQNPTRQVTPPPAHTEQTISVPRYSPAPMYVPVTETRPSVEATVRVPLRTEPKVEAKKTHDKSFAGRYNRVMKISPGEYWDLYENLPEILRVIFVSSELSFEMDDIARVNRLNEEQTKSLISLMGDIILDIQDDQNQEALISKYLGVDSYVAKKIAFSLKNRITENAEGLYKRIQSNIEKETAEKKGLQYPIANAREAVRESPPNLPGVDTNISHEYKPENKTTVVPSKKPGFEVKYRPAQQAVNEVLNQTSFSQAPQRPQERTNSTLSEEALNKPIGQNLGQNTGSRPFGALNKPSAFTDESNFSKPLNSSSAPKIVFGRENSTNSRANIPGWNAPQNIQNINQPYQVNTRNLDKNYWPEQGQKIEREPALKENEPQQRIFQAERPAFVPKFGNATFNDPLKETQNVQVNPRNDFSVQYAQKQQNEQQNTPQYQRPDYQDNIGQYKAPQGNSVTNDKLNNSTYARVENTQSTPITHEYVVDPYREPTE